MLKFFIFCCRRYSCVNTEWYQGFVQYAWWEWHGHTVVCFRNVIPRAWWSASWRSAPQWVVWLFAFGRRSQQRSPLHLARACWCDIELSINCEQVCWCDIELKQDYSHGQLGDGLTTDSKDLCRQYLMALRSFVQVLSTAWWSNDTVAFGPRVWTELFFVALGRACHVPARMCWCCLFYLVLFF